MYSALASSGLRDALLAVTALALVSLAIGAAGRWASVVQLALSLPIGAYAAFLVERGAVDSRAPLVAAGLLVAGEAAYSSLEPPTTRRALYRSAAFTALAAAGAVALGALLIGTAAIGRGTLVEYAFAVGGAAAVVAVLAWLAWSARRSAPVTRR